MEITPEQLLLIAGAALSLLFSYVPGLREWFEALDGVLKRVVMLGLLAATVGAVFGLACTGLAADFGLAVSCDRPGAVRLLSAFVAALIANQAAYTITPHEPANPEEPEPFTPEVG